MRRRLLTADAWRISPGWLVVTLALALAIRLSVSGVGLSTVAGYRWNPGDLTPLLLGIFVFAAGEEVGWRGFALPALVDRGVHPLAATVVLGIPWALLHLPLTLPGRMNEGMPAAAQFITILAMSVLTSWVFLAAGRSITAAVLLHGGLNVFATLNGGLDPAASGWLMAGVYGTVALAVIVGTGGRLGASTVAEGMPFRSRVGGPVQY